MGAAVTKWLHLFGRQLGVNLLQHTCLVDPQSAVIGGLTYSHILLLVVFMQRNYPKHRLRAIQAGVGFAENGIPRMADFGQEKPE
ncbi:hypothetical protein AO391_01735 [Pseudomonas marginalis ICMP 9505]|nr:hypothetical protein AO391_01735 [Pseudomonas marginalis ICMP 9505]